jgi:RHS repeat-associated protein
VLDFERITLNISDDEKTFVRIEQKTGENEVIRYQYDNHLGSACLELDETGQIISYEEYHPFGTTSYRSGRTEIEVSLKRYKYCGKERDEETGLYYYGMRYYAAWLCRFVSVDPLQFKYPYYTPYQYAGNKPITFIDLDGGEEMPNPYDMFVRELKALWDATIGSLFPSKKENEPDKKMNEQKQVEQKKEKIEIAGNNNIQQTTELKQSNTTITIPDNIKFVGNAKAEHVSEYSRNLISKVANEVGITAKITSTKRTPDEQINVMYNNLEQFGIKSQLEIYGTAGDQVIKMYETAIKEGKNEAEIKDVMKEKAIEVNFISPHASPNYNKLNAIDIGYSSFSSGTTRKEFIKKMEESGVRVINEPKNKAIHLEIKQNQTKN